LLVSEQKFYAVRPLPPLPSFSCSCSLAAMWIRGGIAPHPFQTHPLVFCVSCLTFTPPHDTFLPYSFLTPGYLHSLKCDTVSSSSLCSFFALWVVLNRCVEPLGFQVIERDDELVFLYIPIGNTLQRWAHDSVVNVWHLTAQCT
jgi:hypothetical protein